MAPDGTLKWEEDYYYRITNHRNRGRDLTVFDGNYLVFEHLIVHFDYTDRSAAVFYHGENEVIREKVNPFEKYHGDPNNVSNVFAVADEVLAMWGMTRL